ncbi:MAG: protocatechuate 3,4-dioxygenase subunit alpha [Rhodocyclaceae bacterium]
MSLSTTSSQTVGPYYRIGLDWLIKTDLAPEGVAGERVVIEGRLTDADGKGIPDAVLEIWQANSRGRYPSPSDTREEIELESAFRGWGRVPTDDNGVFRFTTIKPGSVPGYNGEPQAPHLNVTLLMRGILRHLYTRMYFPDDATTHDPVLALVPQERRATLIARQTSPGKLHWDVVVQGQGETVFFDC